jgi:tetratricopeptide (TPR) repeat protein
MLGGRKAFAGETTTDTLAAIIEREPQWDALPTTTPPAIVRLLHRCLEKDRNRRLHDVADVRLDLHDAEPKPATRSSKVRWIAATSAAMLAGAATAAWLLLPRKAQALTEKDTIVLADFTNTTGDAVFDGTLRQGLSVQLQQSPFLSLISDQKIRQVLRLMGQPADGPLTATIAKELCQRTASAAVLEGSIASLGSQYVLGLRATNCRTGEVLDEEQVQAPRKEEVLNVLSQVASTFRTRVGESLATIEKHSTPLAEATTSSLDALKAYSTALTLFMASSGAASVPLFERAVQIDPTFAVAHARLGIAYSSLGESVRSRDATIKAYQLRDRPSDQERFFITTMYDRQVTGNLEREQQTLESWAQTYPRDRDAPGLLGGFATTGSGQYELSIQASEKAVALDPDAVLAYGSAARSNIHLGRLTDAEATMRRALDRKLENPDFVVLRYFISFLRGDRAGTSLAVSQGKGKSGVEDSLSHIQALDLARSGRLQEARRMSGVAVEMARQAGKQERAGMFEAGAAVREAFFGNSQAARQRATAALELSTGRDVQYAAAFALALSGESSRARALADDLDRRFPEDTSVQFNDLPTLRAQLSLNLHEPEAAIRTLQHGARFDLAMGGIGFNGFFGALYQVYVRGTAYLAARQPAEAAIEFQTILDHPGIVLVDPMDAMARLQLARAFVMSGESDKAKTAYQNLLTLWKSADPDIPVLLQTRTEFARLN